MNAPNESFGHSAEALSFQVCPCVLCQRPTSGPLSQRKVQVQDDVTAVNEQECRLGEGSAVSPSR